MAWGILIYQWLAGELVSGFVVQHNSSWNPHLSLCASFIQKVSHVGDRAQGRGEDLNASTFRSFCLHHIAIFQLMGKIQRLRPDPRKTNYKAVDTGRLVFGAINAIDYNPWKHSSEFLKNRSKLN